MAATLLYNGADETSRCRKNPDFRLGKPGERGESGFILQSLPGDTWEPEVGALIEWQDNGPTVWQGSISDFDRLPIGYQGGFTFDVKCVTHEARFDKRYVIRSFPAGLTHGQVVESIRSTECAAEGIAAGTIDAGITLTEPLVYGTPTRVSDVYRDLAAKSGKIWYIDGFALYFVDPIPVYPGTTLTGLDIFKRHKPKVTLSRLAYRNRQHVKIAENIIPPFREVLVGDGATTSFTLSKSVRDMVSVVRTTATQSSATGTFTGLPSDGDTITIDDFIYTWRTSNTTSGFNRELSVLIGADAAACAANLTAAINDTLVGKGTVYGWPAIANFKTVATVVSATITLKSRFVAGDLTASANNIPISASCANFTWSAALLSGAVGGVSADESFADNNLGTAQWTYTPGGTTIDLATTPGIVTPATGSYIVVSYRPVAWGYITVQDSAEIAARAAVEGGSGIYENVIQRGDLYKLQPAIDVGNLLLDSYGIIDEIVDITTDYVGVRPGQIIRLTSPKLGTDALYTIQSVRATFIGENFHRDVFRYTIRATIGTRLWGPEDVLESMSRGGATNATPGGSGGPGGPGGPGGGTTTPPWQIASFGLTDDTVGESASAKWVPVHHPGTPFTGWITWRVHAPAAAPPALSNPSKFDILYSVDQGFNWDSIFTLPTVSGTNMVVDASTDTDVTPDGVTPNGSDVGRIFRIISGTGWTTGYYEVVAVVGGLWRFDRSPAAVGTTGGVWVEALGFQIDSDQLTNSSHMVALYGFPPTLRFNNGDLLRLDTLKGAGMQDILVTLEWQPFGAGFTGTSLSLGAPGGQGQGFFLTAMA